jgi:hypothetical protein
VTFVLEVKNRRYNMTTEARNKCERLTVGGADCQHHIKNHKCYALSGECSGRAYGLGVDEALAKKLVADQKHLIAEKLVSDKRLQIALEKLERYRSTEAGLGHLSNRRAVHSSPVPFK